MRRFARTRRWPIAAGEARKALAIRAASRPSTHCSISAAREAGSTFSAARASSSARRWSGSASASSSAAASRRNSGAAAEAVFAQRCASISRRLTAVSSEASGFRGTPATGQAAGAAAKASASASSAAAKPCPRASRKASSRPEPSRATR
jgi:hypothetical protein